MPLDRLPTGYEIRVSRALPIVATDAMIARAIVRHGLADVLRWLGEEPGLAPGQSGHIVVSDERRAIYISQKFLDALTRQLSSDNALKD